MITDIIIAPKGCSDEIKSKADYVCLGEHDELVIQKAIDRCAEENKNIFLVSGRYFIDGFYDQGDGGPLAAICFPAIYRDISFSGQNSPHTTKDDGVILYVTPKALDSISGEFDANVNDPSKNPPDIIRTTWKKRGMGSGASLVLENFRVVLSHNQKPVRCTDLRRCDRIEMKNVGYVGFGDMNAGLGNPPTVAVEGCIGLTATDGSNHSYSNFTDVGACGFYEGMQIGGEHVVMINCNAIMNYYGYTFGNYGISCGANHPITLINCMDERNVCLPLFNSCGDGEKGTGRRMQGLQEVSMISFNIERIAEQSPGGVFKDAMREVYPGTWRGNIDFTAQPAWNHLNDVNFKLWESDGSGVGFKSRNVAHKLACSTEERMSYYPTYCQQIFDTDLGKMLVCIDPDTKKWVDFNGAEV